MKTFNTAPYYDDFDDQKNFHQVLFKPGSAVQARELTQMQTILRGQIEKFGNHVFQEGSVVIPGNCYGDTQSPYVKIESLGSGIPLSSFEGRIIEGQTSGVKAYVRKAVDLIGADPITFYVSYVSGSSTGTLSFADGEEINVEDSPSITATIAAANATGLGSLAFVNDGVFYTRGTFVTVSKQSVVISKYTQTPNCHVLLQINESVVTAEDDGTLLDPAQGSFNYAAPGADRYKISLVLTTLPYGSTISNDYIELIRYREGIIEEHLRYAKYNELEKSLARRTFDESGNYIVSENGFRSTISESLRVGKNGGVWESDPPGDADNFVVKVSPGRAYIEGFEVENLYQRLIQVPKARTSEHIKTKPISFKPEYGQYFFVADMFGSTINPKQRTIVNLYDTSDITVGSPTLVGTAKVMAFDYHAGGTESTHAIYKLWVYDVAFEAGKGFDDVGGIRATTGLASFAAKVVYKYTIASNGFEFTYGTNLTHYGSNGTTPLRRVTVVYHNTSTDEVYAHRSSSSYFPLQLHDSVTNGASVNEAGKVVSTVTDIVQLSAVGQSNYIFPLPVAEVQSAPGITYYAWQNATATITYGTGTNGSFTVDGEVPAIEPGILVAVSDMSGPSNSTSGIIPSTYFSVFSSGTNSSTIQMNGYNPTSGSATVTIYVLTKRSANPAAKTRVANFTESATLSNVTFTDSTNLVTLASHGFVNGSPITFSSITTTTGITAGTVYYVKNATLDTFQLATTAGGNAINLVNNGTGVIGSRITLLHNDVIKIVSITQTYSSVTTNITDNFTLDNGQRDYAYLRGSISLKPGKPTPQGTLTIVYDYYSHGVGDYFSIDSYVLVSGEKYGTTYKAIASGQTYNLLKCLDFRPSVGENGTFTGTGAHTASALANDYFIQSTGINYYVPRRDHVIVDKKGDISVIQGIPAETPTEPSLKQGTYVLDSIFVPAYTWDVRDVLVTRKATTRYSMSDISNIEKRVYKLEQFSTLTAVENNLRTYNVTDAATGLDRFKTGFLVEDFSFPLNIGDITAPGFRAVFANNCLHAGREYTECNLALESNIGNFQITNTLITRPYTERVLAQQPVSSRITNLQPFMVLSWNGTLDVVPPFDTWTVTVESPTVVNEVLQVQTVEKFVERVIYLESPQPPPVYYDVFQNAWGEFVEVPPGMPIIREQPSIVWQDPGPGWDNSGGSGGGTVICTKLYELGLMSQKIYQADADFGAELQSINPDVYHGYRAWADIVVDWMDGKGPKMMPWMTDEEFSESISRWSTRWAYNIATPWAEHMAYKMGALDKDNLTGRIITQVGMPICKAIGAWRRVFGSSKSPAGFGKGAMLISLFALFKLVAEVGRLLEKQRPIEEFR